MTLRVPTEMKRNKDNFYSFCYLRQVGAEPMDGPWSGSKSRVQQRANATEMVPFVLIHLYEQRAGCGVEGGLSPSERRARPQVYDEDK